MVTKRASPTAPPRRERKKAEARERILRVALDLFGRHGMDAVTVDHIADMADLGKGTIYNYFRAKEDIVVAFMADVERSVQAKVARLAASRGNLTTTLTAFVREQFRLKAPHHAFVRVMLGQMFQKTEAFMPHLIAMQGAIDPNLQRLFDGARERGALRSTIPVPDLIVAFKTLQLGLTGLWAIEGPPFRASDKVVTQSIALFCAGLERPSS
jgi:AcrR family transcriptional regulator